MRKLLLLSALLLLPTALHAQQFSSLEERMSYAEFRAAGLDKLSPEELAALNQWLESKGAGLFGGPAPAAAAAVEDRTGFREQGSRETIVSRIVGEFTGFDGRTRFELENGQVWEQHGDTNRLSGMRLNNPGVTIRPGMLGAWYLRVDGYNTTAKVRRVR